MLFLGCECTYGSCIATYDFLFCEADALCFFGWCIPPPFSMEVLKHLIQFLSDKPDVPVLIIWDF